MASEIHQNLTRLPDWGRRLDDYVRLTADRPFRYGLHDCVLWPVGAVDITCGTSICSRFRGTYDDAEGAAAAISANGWATLLQAAISFGARELTSLSMLRPGDLLWLPSSVCGVGPDQRCGALALVGRVAAMILTTDGAIQTPLTACARLRAVGLGVG